MRGKENTSGGLGLASGLRPRWEGKGGAAKGRAGAWPGCVPPIGAAKQQPTPTAQAAASISVFRDSFWPEWWKGVSTWAQQPTPSSAFPQGPPYLIDAPEEGEELAEQGSTHACYMHKRALGGGGRQ